MGGGGHLNFIVRFLNPNVTADSRSYFHFKYPYLDREELHTMQYDGPFGRYNFWNRKCKEMSDVVQGVVTVVYYNILYQQWLHWRTPYSAL